jgi:small conductance mechanosensitive channel
MTDHEKFDTYGNAFLIPLNNTLHRVVSFVPRFLVAIVLFIVFLGLATLARKLARQSLEKVPQIPWAVKLLIARTIYLCMLLVGILVALSAANVNVAAVIASLGVAGFALGFALKDILENFISGIILLFARPFEVGDQITSGAYEGVVQDIEIRTTTLHTYDGQAVVIPNSQVLSAPVINHTRLGRRRYQLDFNTSLDADTSQVERESLAAAQGASEIADEPAPFVRMISTDSGNDILSWRLYFWAKPTKAVEISVTSQMLAQIKYRLFDAGVPTPTSTSATILKRDTAPKREVSEVCSDTPV